MSGLRERNRCKKNEEEREKDDRPTRVVHCSLEFKAANSPL